MQQSTINTKAIVVYGVVGLALIGLIIGGISWAKTRSNQIAQTKTTQGQSDQVAQNSDQSASDQNNQSPQNAAAPSSGDQEVSNDDHVGGASTASPTHVPAAGASDWPLFLGALSVTSYAGAKFVQSRRRLFSLR